MSAPVVVVALAVVLILTMLFPKSREALGVASGVVTALALIFSA